MTDPHTHPDAVVDIHEVIAEQRSHAMGARIVLSGLIMAACPGPHKFVQHRDNRPPWCNRCRYTADGEVVPERESL